MPPKKNDREAKLRELCDAINKSAFGGQEHDAVTWLGSDDAIPLERFGSGCEELDTVLGGGWPKGRFIELFGPESSGKSTLVLHALAEHQRKYPDAECALLDTEYSWDITYASALGVDVKYLLVHQPESGEQALNVLSMLIKGGVGCVVVDSVAALTTKAELEGDLGDQFVGQQARMMSQALRRLAMEAGQCGTTVFWTNQVREKISISYGDKTTTPAGRALRHYASIRLHLAAIGKVKDGDEVVSSRIKADCRKNKTAAPFKQCEFNISFGRGIDAMASLLDAAIEKGVVTKRGSWLSIGEEQLGQGKPAVLEAMHEKPELAERIKQAVHERKEAPVVRKAAKASEESEGDGVEATEV